MPVAGSEPTSLSCHNSSFRAYVYVLAWDVFGPVKIGLAKDLMRRQRMLQIALPFPCYILFSVECGEHVVAVERAAHAELRERHLRGEWFDVSAMEARDVLRRVTGKEGSTDEWLIEQEAQPRDALRARAKEAASSWRRRTKRKAVRPEDREAAIRCYHASGEVRWAAAIAGVPPKIMRRWIDGRP